VCYVENTTELYQLVCLEQKKKKKRPAPDVPHMAVKESPPPCVHVAASPFVLRLISIPSIVSVISDVASSELQ